MRLSVLFCVFVLVYSVKSKTAAKATESFGQEVIEIANPLKELPPDLEEEPSAEIDDDDDDATTISTTTSSATKKDPKTGVTTATTATKLLQVNTIDGVRRKGKDSNRVEEEEAKIEKELAEIYKDTEDYKADSSEGLNAGNNSIEGGKDILRSRSNFKFQPDRINQKEVEKFRTSVDEISCDRSVTKKMLHGSAPGTVWPKIPHHLWFSAPHRWDNLPSPSHSKQHSFRFTDNHHFLHPCRGGATTLTCASIKKIFMSFLSLSVFFYAI